MKIQLFLLLLATSALVNAQELKRVTKSTNQFGEIYYVLKNDKKIKQGQYLKYFESMNLHDKAIESYGSYDNNKKTGAWIFCDAEDMSNPLIAIGEFMNDNKVGRWVYFYKPISDNDSIIDFTGNNKHTKVLLPTRENEKFNITLDTTGIGTAATGDYIDNKKTGIWSYYYKNGSVACKYNFSEKALIYNNGLISYDQLGGIERFKALFHKSTFEKRINDQPFFVQNSNVVFELTTYHDSINIKRIDSYGSIPFAKTMENILTRMPLDWINFDPRLEENKIKVQINYVVDGNIGTVTLDSIKPIK
jgi:antitoxin component YwqK of YwqJK toxin-antitoxin module